MKRVIGSFRERELLFFSNKKKSNLRRIFQRRPFRRRWWTSRVQGRRPCVPTAPHVPQAQRLAGNRRGGPVHVVQRVDGRRRRWRSREDGGRPDHDAADDGHQQRDAAAHIATGPSVAHSPTRTVVVVVRLQRRRHRLHKRHCQRLRVKRLHVLRGSDSAQRVVRLHAAGVGAQFAGVRGAANAVVRGQRDARAVRVPQRLHHASECPDDPIYLRLSSPSVVYPSTNDNNMIMLWQRWKDNSVYRRDRHDIDRELQCTL